MFELSDPEAFNRIVWEIVRQVPEGQVTTFGQIAGMIPAPEGIEPEVYQRLGPRWVGDAMNAVSWKDDKTVPWHRVINSKGTISLPPETQAAALQRARLRHEGIEFNSREQVDFDQWGWEGPEPDWCAEMGLTMPKSLRSRPAKGPQQLSFF
ncbi:MAG: methylated-DNA--protein-cysteine methyltransferase [Chloroflexi bacterium OLB15]|nr:MAG: methylated-DNA--protein-cysteine methyltransferase [Chloroflexi bacterium OLB15]